jgi:glycosyltransferase involved in cell wall biosynthesis
LVEDCVRLTCPRESKKRPKGMPSGRLNVRSSLRTVARTPWRAVHGIYQAIVPYDRRLVFWSWRRRNTFHLRLLRESLKWKLVRALQAELKEILAQYPEANGVVIFPPSVPWYTELFQRPQQMAQAFAAQGYVVLYWVEDMAGDRATHFRKVAERLHLCNVPPAVFWICPRPIFISYTYNYNWATLLRSPVIVYELIDHLDIFSNFPMRMLLRYHQRLLTRARVVVGTADDLVAELKPHRPEALLCPNGVDLAHFATAEVTGDDIPEDMRAIVARGTPIIGYYGALAEWFDFDLVRHAAAALPDYQFVLIGPDYDGLTMQKAGINAHPNIHWLGSKKYAQLPHYLACFDVATIPFKLTEALQAVSPLKLFEYMAGERPIVTTDLVECRKYPVALIARTPHEWVDRLREAVALRHDEAYLTQLRRTAEENTWTARADAEIQALETQMTRHGATLRRAAGVRIV